MEILECNRCGKCKEFCPSYLIFLRESFCPRGRFQLSLLLQEQKIKENDKLRKRIFSCLLCGACINICPLQINIPMLIYETRAKMQKKMFNYFFKYFSLYPKFFFSALHFLGNSKILCTILKKQKKIPSSLLEKFFVIESKKAEKQSFKIYNKIKPKGRVALFLGCSTNYIMPSLTESLVSLLSNENYEIIIPKQNCCGAPLLSNGFKEETLKIAKKNIETYKSFNIDGVITPCPTCAHFIENIYEEITGESINVIQISDLIENLPVNYTSESKIFFHESCHSSNYIKETDKILNLLTKLGFHNIQRKSGCCGFAGIFSFLFEKESMDILQKKVLEYEKADMIITSCPNCIMQFKFAMKDKKIFHYLEIINKILTERGEKNGRKI
ncbi:MAG: (Fe-S)-binding protein [Thermodesulfovibrio sp.]|uniref:(Fe-S)-binding protein n=1 Tax=unclassified Thermodesulfovibrio TaxID=2645936 RepID=UPI00083B5A4A|nr:MULTISPECIES: (Fe-S)-binding protein [unclassified Thermodesulfovibrio]MDI1470947.1 (Fe-S)-binding protein [Thermodesulfovibrio sp. 1176]MDI6713797.1 (Fe-S)-binding protein [Thermodesulfovibrio sp.]ODA45130.1 putative glycolate dehydrogenase, 2-subunit type, iron-sulfur subunit GlcF [Thermodesulfovibrio sp. N1]